MSRLEEKDIEEIKSSIEKKFPDDPALQQVHIARKIIAREAELDGLNFVQYIKSHLKDNKGSRQEHPA